MKTIKVCCSRDNVCAADDVDIHDRDYKFPKDSSIENMILSILEDHYLPSIHGGQASWSVQSKIPFMVVAQQWKTPKPVSFFPIDIHKLDFSDSTLRLHFNYHTQMDPDIVLNVLRGLHFK